VLVTTSDRSAAMRLARRAARSGIETGLLRGDDYNLGTGLWVVFAGRFDTPEGAARQASGLAERFPGAYPQRVEPTG
jgi:SPOR domain